MTFEACCGQPKGRQRRRVSNEGLPPNPTVIKGVAVLYLGSGRRDVRGANSGLVYVVSDHRRHFQVDRADLDAMLANRDFMLQI
jgi:hypothetical protein